MRYLIGNWKSYTTISQTHIWLSEFSQARLPKANLTTIICAPFTNLAEVNRLINQENLPLQVGAQNASAETDGQHTGEVTARMLSELTRYCLLSPSEALR